MKTIKIKPKVKSFNPASNLKDLSEFTDSINETVAGKTLKKLPVNKVHSRPQVRTVFENIDELAKSMAEGQLSPICVARDGEDSYVILQGERRWLAAKKAGLKEIEAIVTDLPKDDSERIFGQLTENIQRDNMKLCDLIDSIGSLIKQGFNQTEIARKLGKDRTYISRLAGLVKSTPLILQLIKDNSVSDPQTAQILNTILAKCPDAESKILALKDSLGLITRQAAQSLLSKIENQLNQKTEIPQKAKFFEDSIKKKDIPKGFTKFPASQPVQIQVHYLAEDGKIHSGFLLPRLVATDPAFVCILTNTLNVISVPASCVQLTGLELLA